MGLIRVIAPERWKPWRVVDKLNDGRECPECSATVHGRRAKQAHQAGHIERREFDSRVLLALQALCEASGVTYRLAEPGDHYEGAAVAELDDYDDEEDGDDTKQYG